MLLSSQTYRKGPFASLTRPWERWAELESGLRMAALRRSRHLPDCYFNGLTRY